MTVTIAPAVLLPISSATPILVSAPPRCNFAGFCDYCGQRGCQSTRCITRYATSWWAVCPSCRGTGELDGDVCQMCLYGVVEATSTTPGAVRPVVTG